MTRESSDPMMIDRTVFSRHLHGSMAAAVICVLSVARMCAEDWPGFRGPTGMGVTTEEGLPLEWGGPEGKNVLWKAPLPPTVDKGEADHNQSSPVVADGRVVVTTAHWKTGTTDQGSHQPDHHVSGYEAATGKQLWDTTVPAGPWLLTDLRGGYAAPTPAIDHGRVFALFGSSILHALDLDGKLLWSHTLADPDKFDVALSASPVVYKDTVLLLLDRKAPAATLIALDAKTGKVRWEAKRPATDFGHMTPVLATVGGKAQLLVTATHSLQGIDPENGKILWFCDWDRPIWPVSSPVMAKGLVYAIGGRGGHPGVVVDPAGSGDVTATKLKWRIGPMSEGLSSPVAFGDLVFRLNSPGILRCTRIANGEELFKERLPGADPAVSPIVTADDRIYFASAGKTVVIQAGPQLKILAESDLGDPSTATAAVADGRIFLKGKSYLYAIGHKKP
jgi:outer membrane protein assembly factor BamB